jgi:adenylate kinase family enzyme
MTTIINLFAGPGAGKSTAAANLFSHLKQKHYSVELVQEYVKNWAYQGKPIGVYDQLYVQAKQMHRESQLLNKVDFIITDSPVWLCAYYAKHYYPKAIKKATAEVARAYDLQLAEDGHWQKNYFLLRPDKKNFSEKGRFHNLEESMKIDTLLQDLLNEEGRPFSYVDAVTLLMQEF